MRVRVIKGFSAAGKAYKVGEIVNIDPTVAAGWLKVGFVMQDKSLDGAEETKVRPPSRRTVRG